MIRTYRLAGSIVLAASLSLLSACSILPKPEQVDVYWLPYGQAPVAASRSAPVSWSLRLDNGAQVLIGRDDADRRLTRFARLLPQLQAELVAVISKYVQISADDIKVSLEKQDNFEVLEVKIELPDGAR